MKTFPFRPQILLAVAALILAGGMPAQAIRIKQGLVYRTAVFQIASTTQIAVGTNRSASLLNLRVGDHVSIAFDQENGAWVARHISDDVPPKPHSAPTSVHPSSAAHHHSSIAPALAHIHGVVHSVDPQAGTLTLAYKAKV